MKLLLITLVLSPFVGYSQAESYKINGKFSPKHNGKLVKLFVGGELLRATDSTVVTKGSFTMKGSLEAPTVGILTFSTTDADDILDVFLSNGNIRIKTTDSLRNAVVTGAKLAETHEQLAKKIRPTDRQVLKSVVKLKGMGKGPEQNAYVKQMLAEFKVYTKFKQETIYNFVKENLDSYVSLYHLEKNSQGNLLNYDLVFPLYNTLAPSLQNTPLGKSFAARLTKAKGILMFSEYKDFTSTTPDGKSLSLKEIVAKNKYTLVDFWASWCGPCRVENPNVVKTFNDFKEKGFTVLSVSLDDDGGKWREAIKSDGMPWYHVSSLKGWKEPVAILYNVRAIPQNVILDDQGKVVAINLRGEALYNKMQELLK